MKTQELVVLRAWVQVGIEAPILLLHVSVLVYIVRQLHLRHPLFSTAFYVLYCVQSAVDITHYVETVVFFRLFRVGLLPKWLGESPAANCVIFSTVFLNTFQYVSHVGIAANRYITIASASISAHTWRRKRFAIALATGFLLSLPPAALRLTYPFSVSVDSQGLYIVSGQQNVAYSIANFSSFVYCVGTCVVSLCLELRTAYLYRKYSAHRRKQLRSDFRLLGKSPKAVSLLKFIGHFLMAVYLTLTVLSAITANASYVSWAQTYHPYVVDLISLGGPVCIMMTSDTLRRMFFSSCSTSRTEVETITTSIENAQPGR